MPVTNNSSLVSAFQDHLSTFTFILVSYGDPAGHFLSFCLTLSCSITISLIHHRGKNHMLKYRDIWRGRLDRTRLSGGEKKTHTCINNPVSPTADVKLCFKCSLIQLSPSYRWLAQWTPMLVCPYGFFVSFGAHRVLKTSRPPLWTTVSDSGQIKQSEKSPLNVF